MPSLQLSVRTALELLALAANYDAGQAWKAALKDAVGHVLLVVQNNPTKPMSQILRRPDIKEALTYPFAQAGAMTVAAVREAWYEAAGDLLIPDDDLTEILDNVRSNTTTAPRRLRQAIAKGPRDQLSDRLKKLSDDLVRRAEFAVEYSGKRATTLSKLHELPETAMKTWHRNPLSKSCKYCIALDGTSIPVGDLFVIKGWKSFQPLLGPPLHPRCRCELEIS